MPSPTPVPTGTLAPNGRIQHVVIIMQENRSTDNLFHGLPGADIASSGLGSNGRTIPLQPIPLVNNYDWGTATRRSWFLMTTVKWMASTMTTRFARRGKMGIAWVTFRPIRRMRTFRQSDVAEYFTLAEQYVFGDRMFQTNQGESFSRASIHHVRDVRAERGQQSLRFENPIVGYGCTAPSNATVALIDPSGNESQRTYPCFEHQTLMDLLDAKQLTWKYYTNQSDGLWYAPDSIRHIRFGPDWSNVIVPETNVLGDIASGHLANVTWINPNSTDSDHPGINKGTGPSWVTSIVNQIGASPYWSSTAIFVVWDDWGGFYDHVAPRVINSYEYGFRVPLIVVSPYARHGYVSHVSHDFGSILKFTETASGWGRSGTPTRRRTTFRIALPSRSRRANFEWCPRVTTPATLSSIAVRRTTSTIGERWRARPRPRQP